MQLRYFGLIFLALLIKLQVEGQTPGMICENTGIYVLDPNGDGYVSKTIFKDSVTLCFVIVYENNNRILRISFNGNEGPEGVLTIYNANNTMVKEASFELIKSPFYASVDITNLPTGLYTAKLVTSKDVHSVPLTVK